MDIGIDIKNFLIEGVLSAGGNLTATGKNFDRDFFATLSKIDGTIISPLFTNVYLR